MDIRQLHFGLVVTAEFTPRDNAPVADGLQMRQSPGAENPRLHTDGLAGPAQARLAWNTANFKITRTVH